MLLCTQGKLCEYCTLTKSEQVIQLLIAIESNKFFCNCVWFHLLPSCHSFREVSVY